MFFVIHIIIYIYIYPSNIHPPQVQRVLTSSGHDNDDEDHGAHAEASLERKDLLRNCEKHWKSWMENDSYIITIFYDDGCFLHMCDEMSETSAFCFKKKEMATIDGKSWTKQTKDYFD